MRAQRDESKKQRVRSQEIIDELKVMYHYLEVKFDRFKCLDLNAQIYFDMFNEEVNSSTYDNTCDIDKKIDLMKHLLGIVESLVDPKQSNILEKQINKILGKWQELKDVYGDEQLVD